MWVAEASASIQAPVELVWSVMLDLDEYGSWNPFIVRVDRPGGRAARVGDPITLHVQFRGGRVVQSRERITTISPPDEAGRAHLEYEFYGRLHKTRLVVGSRSQLLEPAVDGSTVYSTREEFHGLLGFLVPLRAVQDGFRRHARALKQHTETLVAGGAVSP
jgi:hypothetical protein